MLVTWSLKILEELLWILSSKITFMMWTPLWSPRNQGMFFNYLSEIFRRELERDKQMQNQGETGMASMILNSRAHLDQQQK